MCKDPINFYRKPLNIQILQRELIESEKARRLSRLRPHYTNDVWEKRSSPPTDWNKPLPEYMQKEFEATYLNIKAKEMNGEISETSEQSSFCSLM